eukprot:g26768.t1
MILQANINNILKGATVPRQAAGVITGGAVGNRLASSAYVANSEPPQTRAAPGTELPPIRERPIGERQSRDNLSSRGQEEIWQKNTKCLHPS